MVSRQFIRLNLFVIISIDTNCKKQMVDTFYDFKNQFT